MKKIIKKCACCEHDINVKKKGTIHLGVKKEKGIKKLWFKDIKHFAAYLKQKRLSGKNE